MVLNIKNLFKKVCMLIAAATMAVGLGASFAEAGTPGSNTTGSLIDGSVTISKRSITDSEASSLYSIVLNAAHTYDGNPYNIIQSITKESPTGMGDTRTINLYLRVADAQGDAPGASGTGKEWKLYDSTKTNPLNDWQRTNTGTYYVYYYLDGGNNYNDYPAT